MKHIISLGAGVQSSTMALMASYRQIEPMPHAAIFADTQTEPQSVYDYLDYLEKWLRFPVIRVGRENNVQNALRVRTSKKTGADYMQMRVPAFTLNSKGEKGMLWRQCTSFWKIEPIQREVKQYADEGVTIWLGISTDEAHRMKDSQKAWITHRFPLIEMNMSRNDCLDYMNEHGYREPPRSACVFCPYHSDAEWIRLKRDEPEDFAKAVQFERDAQKAVASMSSLDSQVFLHSSRKPLNEVLFTHEDQRLLFGNECEGMCGV